MVYDSRGHKSYMTQASFIQYREIVDIPYALRPMYLLSQLMLTVVDIFFINTNYVELLIIFIVQPTYSSLVENVWRHVLLDIN